MHAYVVKALKRPIFDPNWHFHSEYQLFMVVKGSGTRFIGDSVKQFKAGDITFTGPNLPHLWRSDTEGSTFVKSQGCEGIVVYFHENILGKDLLLKEETIKLRQLFKNSLRGVNIKGNTRKKIGQMLTVLLDLEGFAGVLKLLHILNSISLSPEIELLASAGYTNSLKQGDTQRMNMVYAYVMKNFKNNIALSELAAMTCMAPTSFSRYFKTHANKTFSEFVSEIRVGHACKLLIEKKMNASQVCYESGFRTLSNFNRQFKALTNRTPREYKKQYEMR